MVRWRFYITYVFFYLILHKVYPLRYPRFLNFYQGPRTKVSKINIINSENTYIWVTFRNSLPKTIKFI